jgi:AAHS family benzoate transporter-like MFS transporter
VPSQTFDTCLAEAPLSRRVIPAAVIASTAIIFDGYDLQSLSYALPKITATWHLSSVQAGLLASYTFLALFIGAVLLGVLGDRWGRKRALVLGIVIFALFLGTAGFAQNYAEFAILRFAGGLGMGGVLPGAIGLVTEYLPARVRARVTALAAGCFTLGFVVAAVLAMMIVPAHGWRPMFFLAYLGFVVAALVALLVSESPRFLAAKGRYPDALAAVRKLYPALWPAARDAAPERFFATAHAPARQPIKALWSGVYRQSTITISLLYFFVQFVVYALDFWLVSLLVDHGFSLVHSYSYGIEQAVAATLGGVVLGLILDRVNHRIGLAAIFVAGGVCLVFFGVAPSAVELYILNALCGALIVGGQNVVHILVMDTYDTDVRATGLGWALGVGRIGGVLGPLLGGYLLSLRLPFPAYFVTFAIPSVLAAVCIVALRSKPGGGPTAVPKASAGAVREEPVGRRPD